MAQAYKQLEQHFARQSLVSDASGILHWDTATTMSSGAGERRGEQLAQLARIQHEMISNPVLKDLVAQAETEASDLNDWQQANLREMKREIEHVSKVPADLAEASVKAEAKCELVWREARENNDFRQLLPSLKEVLKCQREIGQARAVGTNFTAYEALLNSYDPGMTEARVDSLFGELRSFLPDFTQQVLEKQQREPAPIQPEGPFKVDLQRKLGETAMHLLGFDFDRGRLDVSTHPFCGGATDDVRITTRYDDEEFVSSMMGVLHETGHALYEQGRPADWKSQPVSQARGMATHESQSLIVEMQACRSEEFISFMAPMLVNTFCGSREGAGPEWRADNLYRMNKQVKAGFIRVDADEVTYPSHVMLRYELERAMISGQMDVEDLPIVWNEQMQKLLGITPNSDTEGCLQDIHWPSGGWGYFPTYTLGAMTAAQLFAKAKEDNYDILPGIERGDFKPLVSWLRDKVHRWGSYFPTNDALLEHATGEALSTKAFISHLKQRYLNS